MGRMHFASFFACLSHYLCLLSKVARSLVCSFFFYPLFDVLFWPGLYSSSCYLSIYLVHVCFSLS